MRCKQCKFDDNCSLKEIAKDITGCTGHSISRELKENEVRCWQCGDFIDKEKAFQDKIGFVLIVINIYKKGIKQWVKIRDGNVELKE